jgi:MazG family protein
MPTMSDAFDRLVEIMDRLRDPGGCPWDREQTLHTLSGYLLEEAHEVVDAIGAGDPSKLREELGDLLIQIVFMARIAREQQWFEVDDVCDGISDKMVRRHPHVFGDREVEGTAEVIRNWEDIKHEEHEDQPSRSTLDGVPTALPGLLKAFRMTEKAAAVGFDWRRPHDVMVKLYEEVSELEAELERLEGSPPDRVREEMGDVLFVIANLARHLGVEPETALQESNAKFMRRFQGMEEAARARGRRLRELTLDEQDALWESVKAAGTDTIKD